VEVGCPSDNEEDGQINPENGNDEQDSPELQISMHALSSTVSQAKTFPLFITIGTTKLVALIDSGSTATFMDPSVIVRTNLLVVNHNPVKVTSKWQYTMDPSSNFRVSLHHSRL
jgi:hypothetical protein